MSSLQTNYNIQHLQAQLHHWEATKGALDQSPNALAYIEHSIDNLAKFTFEVLKTSTPAEFAPIIPKIQAAVHEMRLALGRQTNDKISIFSSLFFNSKMAHQESYDSLNRIEKALSDLQIEGRFVDHFVQSESTVENPSLFRRFVGKVLRETTESIRLGVFMGSKKAKEKRLKKLKIEHDHLRGKLKEVQGDPNLSPSQKAEGNSIFNKKIEELENKIKKLENEGVKAKETRVNLGKIGGQAVKLDLPKENVQLDAMYMDSSAFHESLAKAGGESYTITLTSKPPPSERTKVQLEGLAFPKGANESEMMKILASLGAFPSIDDQGKEKVGAGWTRVEFQDKILFIPDEEVDTLTKISSDSDVAKKDRIFDQEKWEISNFSTVPLKKSSSEGTVMLGTGAGTTYEVHKKEIMAFLMKGLNVMVFNYRGYGESSGTPSQHGFNRDIEAAYSYLKTVQKIPDEHILVKGVCMSGGPSSWLAAKHPKLNLFLDQSYSEFSHIVIEQSNEKLKKIRAKLDKGGSSFSKWMIDNNKSLIHAAIKLLAPAWKTSEEISKVEGHIGILLLTKDEMIKIDRDIEDNYTAALNYGVHLTKRSSKGEKQKLKTKSKFHTNKQEDNIKNKGVSILEVEAEHGKSWLELLPPRKMKTFNPSMANKIAKQVSIENPSIKDVNGRKLWYYLNDCYNDLFTKFTPQTDGYDIHEVNKAVNEMIADAPIEVRDILKEFLSKAVGVRPELLIDEIAAKKRFFGRMQMDRFLKKAGLMTTPIVNATRSKEDSLFMLS